MTDGYFHQKCDDNIHLFLSNWHISSAIWKWFMDAFKTWKLFTVGSFRMTLGWIFTILNCEIYSNISYTKGCVHNMPSATSSEAGNWVFPRWSRTFTAFSEFRETENHWSMNWDQFKDLVLYMCLAGTVVACWSETQEVTGVQIRLLSANSVTQKWQICQYCQLPVIAEKIDGLLPGLFSFLHLKIMFYFITSYVGNFTQKLTS